MENNNDFNPEKEFLISRKKNKKISEIEEVNDEFANSQTQDLRSS